jgi:hypothetical protein
MNIIYFLKFIYLWVCALVRYIEFLKEINVNNISYQYLIDIFGQKIYSHNIIIYTTDMTTPMKDYGVIVSMSW